VAFFAIFLAVSAFLPGDPQDFGALAGGTDLERPPARRDTAAASRWSDLNVERATK
jgi:hypothetical protein